MEGQSLLWYVLQVIFVLLEPSLVLNTHVHTVHHNLPVVRHPKLIA